MRKKSSIERKMLTYFGLIAAASILITLEFVYAIQVATPDADALSSSAVLSSGSVETLVNSMRRLRNKALLMCVVQGVVTLIVLIMFMRRITGPLQHIVEVSGFISEGDLSRTITIRTGDEIGLLGETVNGLTSNIQEIVAIGLSTEESLRGPLKRLREKSAANPDMSAELRDMEANLDGFRDLMSDFKLLPAPPTPGEEQGRR